MPIRRVVTVVVVGLLALGLAAPLWPGLRISHSDQVIAHWRLPQGTFTLTYVHSIDRLPIEETIAVVDADLVVTSTRVRQFGAGMGQVQGEGHGRADGRWWVVEDIGRQIGTELLVRVGAERVDHRVRVAEREVALSPCLAGERVQVQPARLSVITMVRDWARNSPCERVGVHAGEEER